MKEQNNSKEHVNQGTKKETFVRKMAMLFVWIYVLGYGIGMFLANIGL